ncbi:nickel-dependent hydrogenase large subunit [Pseudodesulfovibrio sp.]|uniref:nickel-dependent hydrogenase large subunit n=1 Tax=unclassified Pseudodesulfovibrio TaxID=2661612 RepID=UPI003B007775
MTQAMTARMVESDIRTGAGEPQVVACRGNAFVTRVRLVGGRVDEAWSTGRMMRNMDVLLKGKLDAKGRPDFVHQAHCLCNDGHALAAIRAVENLAGVTLPHCAVLVRRLVQSLRCIQEHLLHVYQFHFSDWVSLDRALRADTAEAAVLAGPLGQDADHFRLIQDRLRLVAESRESRLPESAYEGSDAWHLLLYAHSLESIRAGASIQAALALLECGPKGFKAYRIGGLPDDLDLGCGILEQLRGALADCRDFICTVFPADMARLAGMYPTWSGIGGGGAFLTWDDVAGSGLVAPTAGTQSWRSAVPDAGAVREERNPDWSLPDRQRYRLVANGDDPSFLWGEGAYFWLPAPRHGTAACEVGPLARVMGGWLLGDQAISLHLQNMLDTSGLTSGAMNSTMGRLVSRAVESAALVDSVDGWLDELERTLATEKIRSVDFSLPASGIGVGRVEVPRGTLAHTIRWGEGRILDHDYLIPSLWNFSTRDTGGVRGPLERALLGTSVADANHPVEILRTLHELDPCNGCHVVVEDRDTGRITLTLA